VVWEGTKTFSSWSDVLNITGSKFSTAKADDVLRLTIAAGSGAQLQISYGSSWTNFDGLGCLSIKGNHEMIITSANVSQLKQGIHIKGVDYTLTQVALVTNDGEYTTACETLFGWDKLVVSGATQGKSCTLGLKAYGGAGWYWPETQNLSTYASIDIEFLQPVAETLIVQLLYGDKGRKSLTVAQGQTSCTIGLTRSMTEAYSLNFMSVKVQTLSVGSVNLKDWEGNVVGTGIQDTMAADEVLSIEYYNAAGVRTSTLQPGINLIRTITKGGRIETRKVVL